MPVGMKPAQAHVENNDLRAHTPQRLPHVREDAPVHAAPHGPCVAKPLNVGPVLHNQRLRVTRAE
eukprot:CAMPEP_0117591562 /NCGR_PEP_ID=MMETSP0784-20121206/71603_1 /TAXON_ID=39447 /ORGANISM="" /LENGTH=64 /DNA_ID=CAMNT_0005393301 /DNA_START=61 /DNA_END=252 /DNA_ORIENTATION=-